MTPDPDALEKLAERLEAGECGREIDRAVMEISYVCKLRFIGAVNEFGIAVETSAWFDPKTDKLATSAESGYPVSTDLTACEAVRERVLPGSSVRSEVDLDGAANATVRPAEGSKFIRHSPAPTEAGARLAAVLRALAAKIREDSDHA